MKDHTLVFKEKTAESPKHVPMSVSTVNALPPSADGGALPPPRMPSSRARKASFLHSKHFKLEKLQLNST